MRACFLAAVAVLSVTTSIEAFAQAAKAPLPVRRAGDWTLVEETIGCRLDAPVVGGSSIAAVSLKAPLHLAQFEKLALQLKPGIKGSVTTLGLAVGETKPHGTLALPMTEKANDSLSINTTDAEDREFSAGANVLVALAGEEIVAFSTSRAALKLPALVDCDRRVMSAALGDVPPPNPKGTRTKWARDRYAMFDARDYPADALWRKQSGSVGYVVRIGTDGRVKKCVVVDSSKVPALDKVTCDVLTKRGRYKPALNAAGQPVEDLDRGRVAWLLPY